MTRLIVVINPKLPAFGWYDDPRPLRELMMLINTGQYRVAEDEIRAEGVPQFASALHAIGVVLVTYEEPTVQLSPCLYEILFSLADGKQAEAIAAELGISPRTVYAYYHELKKRFGVETRAEVLEKAASFGML